MVQVFHYAFYTKIENNVNLNGDYTHGCILEKSMCRKDMFL